MYFAGESAPYVVPREVGTPIEERRIMYARGRYEQDCARFLGNGCCRCRRDVPVRDGLPHTGRV